MPVYDFSNLSGLSDEQLQLAAKQIAEEQKHRANTIKEAKRKAAIKALEEFFAVGGEIQYETYDYDITINDINPLHFDFW